MDYARDAREEVRSIALEGYEIIDTPAEEAYDRVARLACRLLNVPTALVSFLEKDRQWFKAKVGLDMCETPIDVSFCAHTVASCEPLVIPDAEADPRFCDNPFITGPPHVRAYIGVPLVGQRGVVLGTVCGIDTRPRAFSSADVDVLRDLADLVGDLLETRRLELERSRAFAEHPQPMLVFDPASLQILDVNEAALKQYGYARNRFLELTIADLRPEEDVPALREIVAQHAGSTAPRRTGPCRHLRADGSVALVFVDGSPATFQGAPAVLAQVTDATEVFLAQERLSQRETLRNGEVAALRLIATGTPLPEVLAHLTGLVEGQLPGSRCAISIVDEASGTLHDGAAPSFPSAYRDAIEGLEIGPLVGSCGTAAFTRQPVLVADVLKDPRWEGYESIAREFGFRSCWSLPVLAREGGVLGTFAVYYAEPRDPQPEEVSLVETVARLAQVALERARDTEALVVADARYRTLINAVQALVWTAYRSGEVKPGAAGWAAFAGEASGKQGWTDALHPKDREGALAAWQAALDSGTPFAHEHRLRRQDGAYRVMTAYAVPIHGSGGRVTEWVGIHLDVTAQRRTEKALKKSETRFRLVAERMTDVVYLQEPCGRYTWVSPSVQASFGYTPDELRGEDALLLVHPEDRSRIAAETRAAILGDAEQLRTVCRFNRRDRTYVWLESVSRLVRDDNGRVTVLQTTSRDVSERVAREAELMAAREEALHAARLKSALLANMSHEIRTPLTGILGFADLIEAQADGDLQEFAQRIAGAGRRLMDTLNSVLDLAQLEAGALRLDARPLCLGDEALAATALLEARASSRGLALRVEAPARPVYVLADGGALGRVLDNLVSNAIKFTPAGHVAVSVGVRDGWAEAVVSDTGVGISAEFLPRLFDEFEQESDGHGRAFEGSGLGLAITKRLVDLMGGGDGGRERARGGQPVHREAPACSAALGPSGVPEPWACGGRGDCARAGPRSLGSPLGLALRGVRGLPEASALCAEGVCPSGGLARRVQPWAEASRRGAEALVIGGEASPRGLGGLGGLDRKGWPRC